MSMNEENIKKHTYKNEKGEEVTDMCTAIRELIEDGREEGREEGRKEERANTERERKRAEKAETELAEYIKRYGKL